MKTSSAEPVTIKSVEVEGRCALGQDDQVSRMDRMYRYTRHVYDLSRRYYLFGRDRMLRQLAGVCRPGDQVLEMGCGTARNLIRLASLAPEVRLYGLDAAHVMVRTADRQVERRRLGRRIVLRQCLAEQLDAATFGVERFDAVFFSYSLSMMPTWRAALEVAIDHLSPDGAIYIVDFWDQAGLPRWIAGGLQTWLRWFGVHHRPELIDAVQDREGFTVTIEPVGPRYAWIATLKRAEAG